MAKTAQREYAEKLIAISVKEAPRDATYTAELRKHAKTIASNPDSLGLLKLCTVCNGAGKRDKEDASGKRKVACDRCFETGLEMTERGWEVDELIWRGIAARTSLRSHVNHRYGWSEDRVWEGYLAGR